MLLAEWAPPVLEMDPEAVVAVAGSGDIGQTTRGREDDEVGGGVDEGGGEGMGGHNTGAEGVEGHCGTCMGRRRRR